MTPISLWSFSTRYLAFKIMPMKRRICCGVRHQKLSSCTASGSKKTGKPLSSSVKKSLAWCTKSWFCFWISAGEKWAVEKSNFWVSILYLLVSLALSSLSRSCLFFRLSLVARVCGVSSTDFREGLFFRLSLVARVSTVSREGLFFRLSLVARVCGSFWPYSPRK